MTEPFFSVVVAARDCRETLPLMAKSLLRQSFTGFEVVIVDDGSQTPLDLKCACGLDAKILRTEHRGVSESRNLAVKSARGKWISFLDADDAISPDRLAFAKSIISSIPGLDFLRLSGFRRFSADGECEALLKGWAVPSPGNAKAEISEGQAAKEKALHLFSKEGWTPLAFIRRDLALKAVFPPTLSFKEDMAYLLGIAPHIEKIAICRHGGYFYRKSPRSLSSNAGCFPSSLAFSSVMRDLLAAEDLPGSLSGARRSAASRALAYDFMQWLSSNPLRGKEEYLLLYRELHHDGVIAVKDAPWWIRPFLALWIQRGLLFPAHCIYNLARAASRLKGVCKNG